MGVTTVVYGIQTLWYLSSVGSESQFSDESGSVCEYYQVTKTAQLLRMAGQETYLKNFERWGWRKMEEIS